MKRVVQVLVLCLFLSAPITFAAVDSIYEYLQRVDDQHKIVLGAKAKGGDSFAAIDVAIGIKKFNVNAPDLETVIEDEVTPDESKILIGHPCDNGLIPISCEEWPYKQGEAVLRVAGNDLIIAGSSLEDTRRAAKIIAYYKTYPILKESLSIIVTGEKFEKINTTKEKNPADLICGDGICDGGERCYSDCADITCFDVCQEEGYGESSCRDQKSNPNVVSCLSDEYSKGTGYCATGKVCCCKKSQKESTQSEVKKVEEQSLSLWQKIILFFKRLF